MSSRMILSGGALEPIKSLSHSRAWTPLDPSPTLTSIIDESRVSASGDDGEESVEDSEVSLVTSDLEFGFEEGTGRYMIPFMRFLGVDVPQAAKIEDAYIELTQDENKGTTGLVLTIFGEAADNSAAPSTATGNISGRTRTTATVRWDPEVWPNTHGRHKTPNIASIIQEIVNRAGWVAGNALMIMAEYDSVNSTVTGVNATRVAEAYDGAEAHGNISLAPKLVITYQGIDAEAPAAPTGLTATQGDAQVSLNWNDNSEPDVDHYNVYRGTVAGFTPTTPIAQPTVSEYVDTGLTNETTYYYKVSAVDGAGNESPVSAEVNETPSNIATFTGTPAVRADDGFIDDNTYYSEGGATFIVGHTDEEDLTFRRYGSWIMFPGVTIPPGSAIASAKLKVWPYRSGYKVNQIIAAQDVDNAATPTTRSDVVTPPLTTAQVDWDVLDTNANEAYMDSPDLSSIIQEIVNRAGWANGNNIMIRILEDANPQGDYVRWRSQSSVVEKWPTLVVEYSADSTAPAAPTGISSISGDGQVRVLWNSNTEIDLAGYNVYYSTTSGFTPATGTKANTTLIGEAETDFYVTGLTNGTLYYFIVTAVDDANNESAASAQVSDTPEADTTAPSAPTGVSASPGDGQATIDWADNTEPDLAGYNVYYSTTSGFTPGAGNKANASLIADSIYTVTGLTNGTTYYFKVTAVDTSGNESVASAEVSASTTTITAAVAVSADDVLCREGAFSTTNDELMAGHYSDTLYNYRSFFRIQLNIPQGATINSATLKLVAKALYTGIPTTQIRAEAVDNAAQVTSETDMQSRETSLTVADVAWTPAEWTPGVLYTSSDISSVIQEIVNRAGWVSGNYINLWWGHASATWTGTQAVIGAEGVEGTASEAASVEINYH